MEKGKGAHSTQTTNRRDVIYINKQLHTGTRSIHLYCSDAKVIDECVYDGET